MSEDARRAMRTFVCKTNEHPNGMIEFLFAIGDPSLNVELIMPRGAFEDFCRTNRVEFLDAIELASDQYAGDFNWSLHKAREQRFR